MQARLRWQARAQRAVQARQQSAGAPASSADVSNATSARPTRSTSDNAGHRRRFVAHLQSSLQRKPRRESNPALVEDVGQSPDVRPASSSLLQLRNASSPVVSNLPSMQQTADTPAATSGRSSGVVNTHNPLFSPRATTAVNLPSARITANRGRRTSIISLVSDEFGVGLELETDAQQPEESVSPGHAASPRIAAYTLDSVTQAAADQSAAARVSRASTASRPATAPLDDRQSADRLSASEEGHGRLAALHPDPDTEEERSGAVLQTQTPVAAAGEPLDASPSTATQPQGTATDAAYAHPGPPHGTSQGAAGSAARLAQLQKLRGLLTGLQARIDRELD